MAHSPKPFFRSARDAWYVQIATRQVKLCPGPKTTATEKVAWAAFHALMAEASAPKAAAESPRSPGLTLAVLFEKYLEWCQKHRAARTYAGYAWHLQAFCDHLKTARTLPALDLKPYHVVEWLDAHPAWGPTYRRNATGAVQRAFNWAEELGYVAANPVRKIKKPAAGRREQVITPDEFAAILSSYQPGDPFRDLLEFSWETGCRPQEVKRVEARHVDVATHRVVFPPKEAKGKKKFRVILTTPRAEEILTRLLSRAKGGSVFRNADGLAWTTSAVNCRFCRLKGKLGTKYALYSIRHGFATRKLEAGLDSITVAALMGHSDSAMLNRVYSHVSDHHGYLRDQLTKAE
jgi:integrase